MICLKEKMRFKLICCDVMFREMCSACLASPHKIDVEFLPKGLHDLPTAQMNSKLQTLIDSVDENQYDAILLGYALCNNGLAGITARKTKIIIPRAHDCITLFFGSRKRYQKYFDENLGTFFRTSGWIERDELHGELKQQSIGHTTGMDMTYEQLVEEYGEDNADFLYETLCQTLKNYEKITFIKMGIEPPYFLEQAKAEAVERNYKFEEVDGDMTIINRLVNGNWDDDFLIIESGKTIKPSYDDKIIKAV